MDRSPPIEDSLPATPREREKVVVPTLLFLVTIVTTSIFGSSLAVGEVQTYGWLQNLIVHVDLLDGARVLLSGLPYTAAILGFFLAHEFGHYFAARAHGIRCTLPHVIPGLPIFIGTFGAVIRIRSGFHGRRALFDVGIAGPLAGLVVALPVTAWGVVNARVVLPQPMPPGSFAIAYGDSLMTLLFARLFHPDMPADAHLLIGPVYVAGWVGLLATSINLAPAGQLDGGHILYAIAPRWHGAISIGCGIFFVSLFVARLLLYGETTQWIVWAILILLFFRRHPPLPYDPEPLGTPRIVLAIVTLVLFLATFAPVPLHVLEG